MRCRRHVPDSSSSVGVCASCLRERLFTLIVAQAQARQVTRVQLCEDEVVRKSDSHRPPLVFPRSESPYVCRRKYNDSASSDHNCGDRSHPNHQLFCSTPQVGPTYNGGSTAVTFVTAGRKKKMNKFSLWPTLFRSRSDKLESDPRSRSENSCESSSSSPSSNWLSSILSARRKKPSSRLSRHDRGMSPARATFAAEDCDEGDGSPTGRENPSESPQKWWKSPAVALGSAKRGRNGPNHNTSGLTFCLSPLVRASPSRQWNQKVPEMSFAGEVRVQAKLSLLTAASSCANRSRKLADLGRPPNR